MIPNKFIATDIISDREIKADNTLTIQAKTAMILEIEKE